MYSNIKYIITACEQRKVRYRFLDKNRTVLVVYGKHFFSNSVTPLNTQDFEKISVDKEYSYFLLKNVIRMPKTFGYLDPMASKGREFIKFGSYEEICADIRKRFTFPFIVKRDNGSEGNNVFICKNSNELEGDIEKIFNQNSKYYDYVALAQEMVQVKTEFRVIVLFNKIELIYEKHFIDNDYSFTAVVNRDAALHKRIEKFISQIYKNIDVHWSGLDVVIDHKNRLWLIELNSCPSFEGVERKDDKLVVAIYCKVLDRIAGKK